MIEVVKKILFILALLLCPLSVLGQTGALQGTSTVGGISATTQGAQSSNKLQGVIPAAKITIYVTGTQTLATLTSDGTHSLSNPFYSNASNAVNPGGYVAFAALDTGYDVVASSGQGTPNCTTGPLCYTQPVTLCKDCYPSSQIVIPTAGCIGQNAVANGCTGANTPQGALNSFGVGMYYTSNYTSGSLTGGIAEAYTACKSAGWAGCAIQYSAEVTVPSTQTITLTTPLTIDGGNHLLHCTNPTGKCLVFKGNSYGYNIPLKINDLIVDGSGSGGSGIELYSLQMPEINLTFENWHTLGILSAAEYLSGGTITGSAGQTCTVGTFNGGISAATGTLTLDGTNAVNPNDMVAITAQGSGATSAPTTAVLSNGTATCSGTIQIYSMVGSLPFESNFVENASTGPGISLRFVPDSSQNANGALFDNSSNANEIYFNFQGNGVGAGANTNGHALALLNSSGLKIRGQIQSAPFTVSEVIGGGSDLIAHDNMHYENDGDGTSDTRYVLFNSTASSYVLGASFNSSAYFGGSGGASGYVFSTNWNSTTLLLSSSNSYENGLGGGFADSTFGGSTPWVCMNDDTNCNQSPNAAVVANELGVAGVALNISGPGTVSGPLSVGSVQQTAGTTVNTFANGMTVGGVGVEIVGGTGVSLRQVGSSANQWWNYDVSGSWILRDLVNSLPAIECYPGAGTTGYCIFAGKVLANEIQSTLGSVVRMDRCSGGTMDGAYVAASSTQATACTTAGGTLIDTGIATP